MQNFPLAMTLQAESAPTTDQGRKRSNNEDWVTGFEPIDPDEVRFSGSLYIVADGVGGASKGERASQYAAQKGLIRILSVSGFIARRTFKFHNSSRLAMIFISFQ